MLLQKTRKFLAKLTLVGLLLSFLQCGPSGNQSKTYPTRPISFIVPWAAGGMTDLSSRMAGAVLQHALGQPVNVINRTGGGGVIGHLAISQAKPDGYTIGAVTVDISLLHHTGITDLTYENYTPLALLVNNPAAITVRNDAPWDSLPDLLADLRANPGKLQASGTAKAGIWDLARMGFLKAAGLPESAMPWVPSQGAAPALQELLAGGVDVVTAALSEVDALRKAGQVRALAVMSDERLPEFPGVPTLKEYGLDWSVGGWVAICGPPDLPADIVATLDSTIRVAVKDPDYLTAMKNSGATMQFLDGEACRAFMAKQDQVNGELLKSGG
ncbi:MAG: tripartite tricarboxylate transporter substrate binding protein [Saprospiraceae bacterium]